MKIGFASDHRGYKLKEQLKEELLKRNYDDYMQVLEGKVKV